MKRKMRTMPSETAVNESGRRRTSVGESAWVRNQRSRGVRYIPHHKLPKRFWFWRWFWVHSCTRMVASGFIGCLVGCLVAWHADVSRTLSELNLPPLIAELVEPSYSLNQVVLSGGAFGVGHDLNSGFVCYRRCTYEECSSLRRHRERKGIPRSLYNDDPTISIENRHSR